MQEHYYIGLTNPSAAIALDETGFIVADDEVNRLSIYRKDITTGPIQIIALKDLYANAFSEAKDQEIDIEGATEIAGKFFWIGSHSTSRKGKFRAARHCLFALDIKPTRSGAFEVKPVGSIYTRLITDLGHDPRFERYRFETAQHIPPKAIGGLSIEGLAATPDGGLLIGFRNPLRAGKIRHKRLFNGKAILIKLLNPFDVLEGRRPKFADPIELDLKGFGIRDIVWQKKHRYLIVAGPYHDNVPNKHFKQEKFQLYSWSEKSNKLKRFRKMRLNNLNIEAAFFYPNQEASVQLLSDDGTLENAQGFRSLWLDL